VRIDHPDGLRDPFQYFVRLRNRAPSAWIVAEKILEPGERLRRNWPIHGTSGYDFLNLCNSLLVYGKGLHELGRIYAEFTSEPVDFQSVARDKKLNVQHEALGSDVNRLANLFVEICERHRDWRDYTRAEIRRAIREVAACLSVYRTYVAAEQNQILDEDVAQIDFAVRQAKERRPDIDPGLFEFMGDVLSLRIRGTPENEFLMRFQQFTAPVMAKGVEDTALYCFNRMIGLSEVGGDPGSDGITLADFHEYCAAVQRDRPYTMSTLSTHDTKRADDVRARLAVLTEIPGKWNAAIKRWSRRNKSLRTGSFPDRNTEYFLYQTLIGAWPISKERLIAYMLKAVREAKQRTSWTQQNREFEAALESFIDQCMSSEEFLADLEELVERVQPAGRINSLAQTLIKFAAPGVPDTYQGGELWDLSLVDPDNRRPVDYVLRRQMLAELAQDPDAKAILQNMESGAPKLWVVYTALQVRRQLPQCFDESSSYVPIAAEGSLSDHFIGFLRGELVAAMAPRWNLLLGGRWGNTSVLLPEGQWKSRLTGEIYSGGRLRVQKIFERFPVALFTKESG
jgi:(1->4)-alpha-D-glucan 1-alpha-D-glucosylmutase